MTEIAPAAAPPQEGAAFRAPVHSSFPDDSSDGSVSGVRRSARIASLMVAGADGARYLSRAAKKAQAEASKAIEDFGATVRGASKQTQTELSGMLREFGGGLKTELDRTTSMTRSLRNELGAVLSTTDRLRDLTGETERAAQGHSELIRRTKDNLGLAVFMFFLALCLTDASLFYVLLRYYGTEHVPLGVVLSLVAALCASFLATGMWLSALRASV